MPEHQQTQKSTESQTTFQKQVTPTKQTLISNPMTIIQRARINPKSLTHADVMQLQRTIGNRAVGTLLSEIGLIPSKAEQAPLVQMQTIPEDVSICPSCLQKQEIKEEKEPLQGKMIHPLQRQEIPEEEELLQRKRENRTGMPDNLKAGVENLSGINMSDVKVHYNSNKPAEVGALAYTQGTDIHVAPGQERHLPHEAWHVVQQVQGRVKPTMQMKGLGISDDPSLEQEADMMGERAAHMRLGPAPSRVTNDHKGLDMATYESEGIVQRMHAVGTDVIMEPEPVGKTHWKMADKDTKGLGDEVDDIVGVTGIFQGPFTKIRVDTLNMWRAHGVAKRFGGSGRADNVGWWPGDIEEQWGYEEWKVAGVKNEDHGLSKEWAVGQGETGEYHVNRTLLDGETILRQYRNPIISAINWGYNNDREAWRQVIENCGKMNREDIATDNMKELNAYKAQMMDSDINVINQWFEQYFRPSAFLVIGNMTLRYTEITAGKNQRPGVKEWQRKDTHIVGGRPWNGRPKENPSYPRNVEYTATNSSIANLCIITNNQVIWEALVKSEAITPYHGIPAPRLENVERIKLCDKEGNNINFYPKRCISGFGIEIP